MKHQVTRRSSRFEKWLNQKNIPAMAKKCGVSKRTIYKWKNGEVFPRPEHLVKIVSVGSHRITYAEIVDHYLALNK